MSTVEARVRAYRSTHSGVEHWKMQRLTAISNVLLVVWFLFSAVGMAGAGYAGWRLFFHNPWNAGLMVALVVSTFWHARLGVQVILEDYVHGEGAKAASLAALTILMAILAITCTVAILMVAIGA